MAARKPLADGSIERAIENSLQCSLPDACQVRVGLNSGFRVHELLHLTIAKVRESSSARNRRTVAVGRVTGGHDARRRAVQSLTVPLDAVARRTIGRYLEERWLCAGSASDQPLFARRQMRATSSPWRDTESSRPSRASGTCRRSTLGHGRTSKVILSARLQDHIELCRVAMAHESIATTQRYLSATQDEADAVIRSNGATNNPNAPFQQHIA